ncbi:hypothetical protein FUT87_25785, partial [Mitsuaria sp. TWR114]|uniref:hypothetical protein n=1 Tax=Mitsuaria sp. TWR114 TaxID=2601731 RepID=UPI0011BF3E1F
MPTSPSSTTRKFMTPRVPSTQVRQVMTKLSAASVLAIDSARVPGCTPDTEVCVVAVRDTKVRWPKVAVAEERASAFCTRLDDWSSSTASAADQMDEP